MKVYLRQRKQTKKGSISLYLEIYKGIATTPDGRRKILRDYEYLNLYLVDKPKTEIDKKQNKETLQLAKDIKAKRELEIKNGQYGFTSTKQLNTNFIQYFNDQAEKRLRSKGNYDNWNSSLIHLIRYAGKNVTFKEIDPAFCQYFNDYLSTRARTKADKPLSSSSVASYFSKFKACLKQAVKDKIILSNPCDDITTTKAEEAEREYLTLDEIKAVAKKECRYDVLKRAFLFSCLTGLRWSDIQKLRWSEVQKTDDGHRIVFHQQKTKGLQYLDISDQAKSYMGETGQHDERVFIGLRYSDYMNVALEKWMMKAGISKHITFHSARHSFAVMQLELETPIYTLKELLGHKELRTTEIYSKILDKKKKEAMNKIPDITN